MAGSSKDTGDWLITYSDFITLLLIFFILIYTLTPGIQKEKFQAIIGAFQKNDGILEYRSVTDATPLNVRQEERAKNWENLQNHLESENLAAQIQLDLMPEGIRITLGERVSFDSYSAELKPTAQEILSKIGQNLHRYTAEDIDEIEISGYTDDRPVLEGARLFQSNWELGAARATSVLEFFVNRTPIEGRYFKASTYGPYRPRTTNDTPERRRENRRVEIYVRYEQPDPDVSTNSVIEENTEPIDMQSYERDSNR